MFAVDLLAHEKIEGVTHAQIADAVGLKKVERHGLENETAVNHIARSSVVVVTLHEIRPDRAELDVDTHWLLVSYEIEFDGVAFELSLDHLGHLHAPSLVIDEGIARDRMTVDRKKDVALLQDFPARAGINHRADEDTTIVIFQAEEMTLGR